MCADYCSCKCAQSSELSDRARQTRANETTTASTFTNCFECQSVGNLSRTVGLDQLVVSFGIKLSPSFIYSDLLQICRTRCRTTDLQSYVCRKSTQVVRDKSSEIENWPGSLRATAGPGKPSRGASEVENFWILLFKKVQTNVFYILYFSTMAGPPKRRGARGSLPVQALPHPLDGPVLAHWSVRRKLNRINSVQFRRSVRALTDWRLKPISKLISP